MGWAYGDVIMWTYRSEVMPMRVVRDTADELVVWQAPGTGYLTATPNDGKALRDRPVEEIFSVERSFCVKTWLGDGTLRVARSGASHSSWLFRTPDMSGTYLGWYGNLEMPLQRHGNSVQTIDGLLDVFLDAQGNVHWKDEHELAAAVRVGRVTEQQAAAIRAEGERVYADMQRGSYPYDGSWLDWRPDPSWTVPPLPAEFCALAGAPERELFPA